MIFVTIDKMTFVTIDKLVSPSSSVDGDPLDDFPDHWQPRFSAQFSFAGQVKGQTDPPPPNKRSVRCRLLKPAVKPSGLLSRSRHLRDKMFTHRRGVN